MAKELINRSDEFRKLLFRQAELYNIPFTHLCNHISLDYDRFIVGYANIKMLSDEGAPILVKDKQLMKMGEILGINVRIMLVVKEENKMREGIQEIKKKLKDEYIDFKKA